MSNKIDSKKENASLTRKIIISALIFGSIGAVIGLLDNMGIFNSPIDNTATLIILGAVIGIVIGLFAGGKEYDKNKQPLRKTLNNTKDSARLQLREEQLEISKELVDIADVTFHKEVINEEKTVTVPVIREELVIEKRSNGNKYSEVMRIPLTEERVEIVKNPIKLEDVSIYRNRYQETEHLEETIMKEKAHIKTSGNVKVVGKNNKKNR
jgi:uncharacterized protein (TIGR02271 family)